MSQKDSPTEIPVEAFIAAAVVGATLIPFMGIWPLLAMGAGLIATDAALKRLGG